MPAADPGYVCNRSVNIVSPADSIASRGTPLRVRREGDGREILLRRGRLHRAWEAQLSQCDLPAMQGHPALEAPGKPVADIEQQRWTKSKGVVQNGIPHAIQRDAQHVISGRAIGTIVCTVPGVSGDAAEQAVSIGKAV